MKSAQFTSVPTGQLTATVEGGVIQAPFEVAATFEPQPSCTCATGAYRQYIMGLFTVDNIPQTKIIAGGRTLSSSAFDEDGDRYGNVYGHREGPYGPGNFYYQNQATGCNYLGNDAPFINLDVLKGKYRANAPVTMNLFFRGELIDTIDNSVFATKNWSVIGWGLVPE